MKLHRGLLAGLLTVLLCVSMLGSVFAVPARTSHDCIGEGCAVCMILSQCDARVRMPGIASVSFPVLLCMICAAVSAPVPAVRAAHCGTPVTWKVRLLN